jgi:signal transduction histidine kinase
LSIVKSLVEMHGGSVMATSAGEGHGTTIAVQAAHGWTTATAFRLKPEATPLSLQPSG